jgi:hypothetical protein
VSSGPIVTNTEFVETMFADLDDDAAAMLCGFAGDPYAPPEYAWAAYPWQHGSPLPWRLTTSTNNYVAVSSFTAATDGRYRRRKAQFRRLHAVMIDDVGTKVAPHRLRLDVSARVETSPGNYQDFLFVAPSDAAYSLPIATRLIEQLVAHGLTADGRDPGMKGVTRVGRLPVGVNGKQKYIAQLGHPFPCRLVAWSPDRRYTVETIANAFGLDLTPPAERPRRPVSADVRAATEAGFARLMQVIHAAGLYVETTDDGEYGRKHIVVCPWVHTHTDRAETGTVLIEPSGQNNHAGGFKCHHGHCEHRTIADAYRWMRAYLARRAAA